MANTKNTEVETEDKSTMSTEEVQEVQEVMPKKATNRKKKR